MGSQPTKIFGIGLSRTGTTSLMEALSTLGHSCIHFPPITEATIHELLDPYDAAADISVARYFRELDAAFPGSRFVLTTRDLHSWLGSMQSHWSRHTLETYPLEGYRSRRYVEELRRAVYGAVEFEPETYALAFRSHIRAVESYFEGRPDRLLTLSICAGDGWDRLCPFLGIPLTNQEFPRANPKPGLASMARRRASQLFRAAWGSKAR